MRIYRAASPALAALCVMLMAICAPARGAPGDAKLIRGRLGVGFTNQIATAADSTIPALSAKYYLNPGFATSLGLGFDTRSPNSTLALGLKLYKNVFFEPNLIFYVGGGAAYVNRVGSKLQASFFLGSEFFFEKLPSLGFSFEAGVRGDNTTGSFAIRTTGDSFLSAGMHFYF
jgi:hypothetical protein